jgi:hypothetical protein
MHHGTEDAGHALICMPLLRLLLVLLEGGWRYRFASSHYTSPQLAFAARV